MSSTRMQHRIDPVLKEEAEEILLAQGIKPAQAITVFYTEIKRTGGFPFLPSRVPNEKLAKDLGQVKKGKGIRTYKNKKDLFATLDKLS